MMPRSDVTALLRGLGPFQAREVTLSIGGIRGVEQVSKIPLETGAIRVGRQEGLFLLRVMVVYSPVRGEMILRAMVTPIVANRPGGRSWVVEGRWYVILWKKRSRDWVKVGELTTTAWEVVEAAERHTKAEVAFQVLAAYTIDTPKPKDSDG